MNQILPQVEELISTLKQLMPTIYQQETLESLYRFSLHRFGQKTLLGVYRWLILSLISYLLAYWAYLYFDNPEDLDWCYYGQQALILLLPHVLLLSLLEKLESLIPWLNERGFDFCLMRCKI